MVRARGRVCESILRRLLGAAFRHPRAALLAVGLITVGLGLGIPRLRVGTGLLDFLPGDHPHVEAFRSVLEGVDGVTNQELVWLELDPEKAAAAGVETILDERAIRAQEEFSGFVRERVPEVRFVFGLPHWLKLTRAMGAGGDPELLALPDSSFEFNILFQAVWSTQRETLETVVSGDRKATLLGFIVEGDPLSEISRELGRRIDAAIREYRESEDLTHDLFLGESLIPVGLASGMARMDGSLLRDVWRLGPWAVAFVALALAVAFRRAQAVLLALGTLALGLAWVFGAMGWLGVRLNLVNVALVPLLLGTGIDFSIHLLNDLRQRAGETDPAEAVEGLAGGAGMALLLTTTITIVGLVSLAFSGVSGMAELGLLAAGGLVGLFLLVLVVPAAWSSLVRIPTAEGGARSALMEGLLGGIGHRRPLAAAGLVILTAVFWLARSDPVYQLDVIQGNFPGDHPVSAAVRRIRAGVGGAFPEFVILRGDLTDPATLEYARKLGALLRDEEIGLGGGTQVLGPSRVLGSYEVLKDGMGPALMRFAGVGGQLDRAAPTTREEIRSAFEFLHGDPGWAPVVQLLTNRELDCGVLLVMPDRSGLTLPVAEDLWERLEAVIAAAEPERPEGVEASFLGYRTLSVLFIRTTLRWMGVLFAVSFATALVCVAIFLPGWRPLLGIALLLGLTGVWWGGLLRLGDVYVSVFLLFPLIFLVSIGSDYALHLFWHGTRSPRLRPVYGTTGKAVLFSAITDGGVFVIFTAMGLESASQVMLATALAVVAMLGVTVLVVPLVMGKKK